MTTAPENVAPLVEAAHRYIADRSGKGCRTATVTVTANSSSIEDLENGFAGGWAGPGFEKNRICRNPPDRVKLLGPRPDIWIPDSRLVAEKVRDDLNSDTPDSDDVCENSPLAVKADLGRPKDSVASSPIVLGVFANTGISGARGPSLSALLGSFRSARELDHVARPSPDTSQSGLLSTPVLHQALRPAGLAGGTPREAERFLDQSGISADDTGSLLCGLRKEDTGGRPPDELEKTALILPESSLARYDQGEMLSDEPACLGGRPPSPEWRLYPFYADDLPVVDYPFVHVTWPGEDTTRRYRAVEDFREWLTGDRLARDGFRTTSGELSTDHLTGLPPNIKVPDHVSVPGRLHGDPSCVGSLDQVLGCYKGARPPPRPVTLLLDISGSMANTAANPTTAPRLARAEQLAQRIVAGLQPTTPISLLRFSSANEPARQRAVPDTKPEHDDVLGDLQQTIVRGRDLPLATAIAQTANNLRRFPGTQTLVVLTDGQSPTTNPDYAHQATELAAQLAADRDLQVLIVTTDPSGCGQKPAAAIDGALRGHQEGQCVPESKNIDLANTVVTDIVWR